MRRTPFIENLLAALLFCAATLLVDGTAEAQTDCSLFVMDLSHPDGTVVSPGESLHKGWRLSNCGETSWSGYRAVLIEGSYGPLFFDAPLLPPGGEGDVWTTLTAPTEPGLHRTTYRLAGPQGPFGEPFWIEIDVRPLPTVSITEPAEGAVFQEGGVVNVSALTDDPNGTVVAVEFYADRGSGVPKFLGRDRGPKPAQLYGTSWQPPLFGEYVLTAVAIDASSRRSTSPPRRVTVERSSLPALAIQMPLHDAAFPEGVAIPIEAELTDPRGVVESVSFFAGTQLVGKQDHAPWAVYWSGAPAGTHRLTAVAHDKLGSQVAQSEGVPIAVGESIEIIRPARDAVFSTKSSILVEAKVTDPEGIVASVSFYAGTQLLGTRDQAPWAVSWTGAPPGDTPLTAIALDRSGLPVSTSPAVNVTVKELIRIAQPQDGSVFLRGDSILVQADVTDPEGTVARVAFFLDSQRIGEQNHAPWALFHKLQLTGNFSVTAVAYDVLGNQIGTSAPSRIQVKSGGGASWNLCIWNVPGAYPPAQETRVGTARDAHDGNPGTYLAVAPRTGWATNADANFSMCHVNAPPVKRVRFSVFVGGAPLQGASVSLRFANGSPATPFLTVPLMENVAVADGQTFSWEETSGVTPEATYVSVSIRVGTGAGTKLVGIREFAVNPEPAPVALQAWTFDSDVEGWALKPAHRTGHGSMQWVSEGSPAGGSLRVVSTGFGCVGGAFACEEPAPYSRLSSPSYPERSLGVGDVVSFRYRFINDGQSAQTYSVLLSTMGGDPGLVFFVDGEVHLQPGEDSGWLVASRPVASNGYRHTALHVDFEDGFGERNYRFFLDTVSLGSGAALLTLDVTPDALTLNEEGWLGENPVTASTFLACSSTNTGSCAGTLELLIESADPGDGRFYIDTLEAPLDRLCTVTTEDHSEFSFRSYRASCAIDLSPGGVVSIDWKVWVQPSEAAKFDFSATWLGTPATDSVVVPGAEIHPLVFLHGISGSMPPDNKLLTSADEARDVLDPFLGVYWPLLGTLQKMGYEWNKTLFALAYDWRQSNAHSGGFLGRQLQTEVIPRSRAQGYVTRDGRADLVVHSMGGLVSRAYIQGSATDSETGGVVPYDDDVNKVIFVASPHKGFPFDYRTWEGMTWEDYMSDAPSPIIPNRGTIMGFTMDQVIWPELVLKRYKPTRAELAASPLCDFFIPITPGLPPLPRIRDPRKLYVHPVDSFLLYECDRQIVYEFAHSPDPKRGVRSLPEMLPTEDLSPYLINLDGDPPDRPARFPFGHEVNTFLQALNGDIGKLVTRLGDPAIADNVFVIYGDRGPGTDMRYEVDPPGSTQAPGVSLWAHGEVTAGSIRELALGDNLIPASSMSLVGLLDLPGAHRVQLDASPPPDAPGGSGRHNAVLYHPETQRKWVPRFLAGVELPFTTDYDQPFLPAGSTLSVVTACPINLLITDPQGRRLGYDVSTGMVLREIPSAVYTGPGRDPQIVLIPDPLPGIYDIQAVGYSEGAYSFRADRTDGSGLLPIAAFAGVVEAIGQTDTFEVDVPVGGEHRPPEAAPDSYALGEDSSLQVPAPGVLANDRDPDGEALTASLAEGVRHGSLSLRPDGSFSYTPQADFRGSDGFTYRAHDGERESAATTVRIDVRPVNDAPIALDDVYATGDGAPLAIGSPGVLANDFDVDGDPVGAVLLSGPAHGELTLHSDGAFLYTPEPGFRGTDSFTYLVNDGRASSNVATASIAVTLANEAPVAEDDVYRLEGRGEIRVAAPGVLANDFDAEGSPLTSRLVDEPEHGTVTLREDGSFVYTARGDVASGDRFTYVASDRESDSNVAVVSILAPAGCEELYGIDAAAGALVRIDAATGSGTLVGGLGIPIAPEGAGLDFDRKGNLWGFSRSARNPDEAFLYTIDVETGAASFIRTFDVSAHPGGSGIEFGPDGKTLFLQSGTSLSILDVDEGEILPFAELSFSGEALTLPGRCQDFLSFDSTGGRLMRVSAFDGAEEEIGPSDLDHGIQSLAGAPDGTVYGHGEGKLYTFHAGTGEAALVGETGFHADALAFRPPYSKSLCLDARFDRKTGLSRHVVRINEKVRHVNECDGEDRCERHGKKECGECRPEERCGKCGTSGYYRLKSGGRMVVHTAEIREPGLYRVQLQVRARKDGARLVMEAGEEKLRVEMESASWRWTEPMVVELTAGVNRLVLRNGGEEPVDVEGLRIERDCPRPCQGEKVRGCLDRGFQPRTGLSRHVVLVEGRAGHRSQNGCCGGNGSYFVGRGAGRIVAQFPIPVRGRYLFRFRYRLETKAQGGEVLHVLVGGRGFDFDVSDLKNTNRWEWSPKLEVQLEEGAASIEFVSAGGGRIELENVQLERACECGG